MRVKRPLSKELIFIALILMGSCTRDFELRRQSFPLIQTTEVTNIDRDGAQFNAQVIKTGTDPVIDFGFKYVERPTTIFKTVTDTFSISVGGDFTNNFSKKVNHNLFRNLTYHVMAYATTVKETVIGDAVIFKSLSTSPIQITSFSPASVLDGDTLTIFGENFNRYGADYVYIGDQLLINALQFNNKLVTIVVPPISQAGPINVTVDAFYSKANSDQLIVVDPSISSFSPTHGQAGRIVILNGRFSSNINYNRVFFNGIPCPIFNSTRNQITVWVPSGVSGNVSISVNVNGKTFTATDPFFVE